MVRSLHLVAARKGGGQTIGEAAGGFFSASVPELASLAEHFRRSLSLETILLQRGRPGDAETVRLLSSIAEIEIAWQEAPLGLANAVGCARALVGDEPFGVILPDALIDSPVPCLKQLLDCYDNHAGCIVATQTIDDSEIERFGILNVIAISDACCAGHTTRVTSLHERPRPGTTASRQGIFSRYILEPEIFTAIELTHPGLGGELQLTDSLSLCCGPVPLYAYTFKGTHYDCGSPSGFLEATISYAMKDPVLANSLRAQFDRQQRPVFQATH